MPSATNSAALVTDESRLYSLPSAAFVINPPNLGLQVQTNTEVQLKFPRLPHEALQDLHTSLFQEIQHRYQQVHQ